ncbi:hypothetical protein A3Q56_01192 [Intoshia linei]|uniref:Uncharacterized protein n=1 Tax=Intoshia linei TaxID=1819745 RepID=A0A177BBP8_9BILA|nr:hypothetical protein A3Q56_01192 [Intoshia linei]
MDISKDIDKVDKMIKMHSIMYNKMVNEKNEIFFNNQKNELKNYHINLLKSQNVVSYLINIISRLKKDNEEYFIKNIKRKKIADKIKQKSKLLKEETVSLHQLYKKSLEESQTYKQTLHFKNLEIDKMKKENNKLKSEHDHLEKNINIFKLISNQKQELMQNNIDMLKKDLMAMNEFYENKPDKYLKS